MPKSTGSTTPSQFRLSDDTLGQLDRIADHYGLRSRAAAIRLAAKLTADQIGEAAKKTPRKSPKGA